MSIVERLQEFIENEARSCSMDFGCITPEYVYRMWGGSVRLEEIDEAMAALKVQGFESVGKLRVLSLCLKRIILEVLVRGF